MSKIFCNCQIDFHDKNREFIVKKERLSLKKVTSVKPGKCTGHIHRSICGAECGKYQPNCCP